MAEPLKTFKKAEAVPSRAYSDAPKPRTLPPISLTVSEKFEDFTFLIYGERKIGKSSLFAQFKNPFFMFFEPGGKSIAGVKKVDVPSWSVALEYISLLEKNPDYCDLVIIDTGYMAYERCFEYSLKKLGITDPKDKGWGVAWKFIDKEFREFHMRLTNAGKSFGVAAHSEMKTLKRRDGSEYDKLSVQLGGQATRFYTAVVDIIGYFQYIKGARFLTIRGDENIEAGTRLDKNFLDPRTRAPLINIPMGKSPKEGYHNLTSAFQNKLPL